jgi:hypothetical protein
MVSAELPLGECNGSDGVLECWINGLLENPTLQYSNTPSLHRFTVPSLRAAYMLHGHLKLDQRNLPQMAALPDI